MEILWARLGLWCDSRNEAEGHELTELFGVKMPKRATGARWVWTTRNQTEKAKPARHMTTPAGWISYHLTGQWTLGIGDAAGMFPIDQSTLDYDASLLAKFDDLIGDDSLTSLKELLPAVRKAGEGLWDSFRNWCETTRSTNGSARRGSRRRSTSRFGWFLDRRCGDGFDQLWYFGLCKQRWRSTI